MATRANYFKVGAFIIVAIAMLAGAIVVLGAGSLLRRKVRIETYFDESVEGLVVGSPVKYRGVEIGKVEHISLTSAKYEQRVGKPFERRKQYVLVEMTIFADAFEGLDPETLGQRLANLTKQGLRVRLTSKALTGIAYVELDYVSDPALYPEVQVDWQPDLPYIPSALSIGVRLEESIESITRTLKEIEKADICQLAGRLEDLLTAATESVDEAKVVALRERADQFLSDADGFIKDVGQTNREVREAVTLLLEEVRESNRLVRDFLEKPELDTVLADASEAARGLKRIVLNSEADIDQITSELRETSQKLNTASEDLPRTLDEFNIALRRLSRLIGEQRHEIAGIMENMERASENLNEMTEDAKRYPAHFLFGEPPPPQEATR